jgi:hypothetical protein
MSSYPSYLHAWTQSDRLAIAQNFQKNGFDFLHPATYNLLTKDGITQVDFPIHDYLVSIISKVFSIDIVSTFRFYNLLFSWLGLIFFFKLCLSIGLSGIRSVFATSFLFTIPFFVFYQNGFLPSVPSFSNFLIGLYFFNTYFQSKRPIKLWLSALFLSLSALSRSPFLIYLITAILSIYWKQIRKHSLQLFEGLPFVLGFFIFIAYQVYNNYLAAEYGSMFLQKLLYIDSFDNLYYIIESALDRWSNQILSPFHAVLLIGLILGGIIQLGKRKKLPKTIKPLTLFLIISFFGVFLFFIAMGNQFIDHDYYYIDSLLPLLSILILINLKLLCIPKFYYTAIATISAIFFFYLFSFAKDSQISRYTPPWNDRVEYAYSIYNKSNNDLKDWGLKTTDTVIVLEANSTNIPFTVWNTKGYTSLNSTADSVKSLLNLKSNYVTLIDSFFRLDTYRDYPGIVNDLELVNTNGELSLYKVDSKNDGPQDFFRNYHFASSFDFDNSFPSYDNYSGFHHVVEKNGNKSIQIDPQDEYTLTLTDTIRISDKSKSIKILLVADYFQTENISKIQLICSYGDFYHSHFTENTLVELDSTVRKLNKWEIPVEFLKEKQQIKIYFWNQDKRSVKLDNYNLIIYQ